MVSVIIPTYKRELEKLRRAVESVLAQGDVEIIVVDDNPSLDARSPGIKAYCETQDGVRYIKQAGNQGSAMARNLGIANARGDVIGFIDDDDEWLPGYIDTMLPHLTGDVKLVCCCGWTVDDDGARLPYPLHYVDKPITFDGLLAEDTMQSIACLVDRKTLLETGGFDASFWAQDDYILRLSIAKEHKVTMIPDKLFLYYLHKGEHISTNHVKKLNGALKLYEKYKTDFKQNKKAYANVWFEIWFRRHNLRQPIRAAGALIRCVIKMPKYLARAVMVTTRSEKLKRWLNTKRVHRTDTQT